MSSPSNLAERLRALPRSFTTPNIAGEIVSFGVAFAVGAGFHFLLKKFWQKAYGHEAPVNPSTPGVKWTEALLWGLATGAAAGAAKVVAKRGADVAKERLA